MYLANGHIVAPILCITVNITFMYYTDTALYE